MIRISPFTATAIVFGMMLAGTAAAAVSADEAKQLGATLTPWGAEKAGNKDGTIPEWTGQVKIPASYDPKKPGVRPDPFADEKPLFSISAQNMDKYGDKLSEGVKALMKKYPTYRVDVYPSHRTQALPQYVIDNTIKNATACKGVDGGLKLEGCYGGLPFPIPKTGTEAMWNHNLAYKLFSYGGNFSSWYIDTNGTSVLQGLNLTVNDQPWYDPKTPGVRPTTQIFWRFRMDTSEPSRKAGESLVLLDPVDTLGVGRRLWQYIPGQRRVKLAPDLAYDTPTPQSGGSQNMDDAQVYLGALDRFDWKLLGKKEMYIPYNDFKFNDGKSCPNRIKFSKNHPNPDCLRWELHRVWVVQGDLKSKFRHVYKKRMFYWDEDAQGAGIGDNFDASGNIYRVSMNATNPLYESKGWLNIGSWTMDVQTGVWAITGEVAETGGWYELPQRPDTIYSPEDMAAAGIR
jgi:hypothetical protein